MAKRFVDTTIWGDKWFRKLPVKYKCLWKYLCDNCDNAGVWKVDLDLAVFQIGEAFDSEEALRFLNDSKERVAVLNHGTYWQVKDFVQFQFGTLTPNSRVHESVLNLIEGHRVSKGYAYPIDRVKNKNKDKDKERGCGGKQDIPPSLQDAKAYFLEQSHPNDADKFFDHFTSNGWRVSGKAPMKDWKAAARNWIRNKPNFQTKTHERSGSIAFNTSRPRTPSKTCTACNSTGKLPDGKKCWCFQ
jgi:hypothetical protein